MRRVRACQPEKPKETAMAKHGKPAKEEIIAYTVKQKTAMDGKQ